MQGPVVASIVLAITLATSASAQLAAHGGEPVAQTQPVAPHRTRLILKDGTYQFVMSYKVLGSRVQYVSAERGGQVEEIPLDLVDLEATRTWDKRHQPSLTDSDASVQRPAPAIDPEVAREEADRRALTPEVAPDLRLVPEDTVLALDTWHGTPELVPLQQSAGDLNRETGHSILRAVINPYSSRHEVLTLHGEKSPVQMHVDDPAFYIRMADDAAPTGEVMTVDTHGASSSGASREKRQAASTYAIVRIDVRQGARVVATFSTTADHATRRQDDVIDTTATLLPGGHWTKILPTQKLLFGEYCLIEVLGENQINLSVWDFGIHPTAPENRDVILPHKWQTTLEHRSDE